MVVGPKHEMSSTRFTRGQPGRMNRSRVSLWMMTQLRKSELRCLNRTTDSAGLKFRRQLVRDRDLRESDSRTAGGRSKKEYRPEFSVILRENVVGPPHGPENTSWMYSSMKETCSAWRISTENWVMRRCAA
ncbi:pyridoxal phosphate (PLP)-dependent transferasessuperfamily protein [Striga asiatica]|uniref:Pyridoxal phosphate (PLP)-dependent transferasessuperfamily protein n=1 Tax=Striga asiatica TaxID=4170 RepID=A0A5A7P793_STRAF|nr:pyridoxal phosphate (PLP)-dependent transferasessuperfamily protein [Striga asiatica]